MPPHEAGRYAVEVIAGVKGTLHIPLRGLSYGDLEDDILKIESDFSGDEWNLYEIRVRPLPGHVEKMAQLKIRNANNPGNARAYDGPAPPRTSTPPSLRDLERLSRKKRRVRLPTAGASRSVQATPSGHEGRPTRLNPLRVRRSLEGDPFVDVGTAWDLLVHQADGGFSRPPARLFKPQGRLSSMPQRALGRPVSVEVDSLSPTLAAYSRVTEIELVVEEREGLGKWLPPLPEAERLGVQRHRRSALLGREIEDALEARSSWLWINYADRPKRTLSVSKGTISGSKSAAMLRRRLSEDDCEALREGNLRIKLGDAGEAPLLVFRCIGHQGEALPWVEASLLDYDDDVLARRMLDCDLGLAKGEKRPGLGDLADGREEMRLLDLTQLSDIARRHYPSLDAQERFWRQGAWYDTHSRHNSDSEGYVLSREQLEPGEVYVLYLWSNSRDDLRPDRRFVFRATTGVNDLGAISLPSYR